MSRNTGISVPVPESDSAHATATKRRRALVLAVGAIGVVYGDIGTSPLYTMRECFAGTFSMPPTQANVFGILSLIFWSMATVISLKYVAFIMKADNRGEGGILALLALTAANHQARCTTGEKAGTASGWGGLLGKMRILPALGLFGAALFYGDAMITPAISVLSAVEGLDIATPMFRPYVVPITLVVLFALFVVQRQGTERVGRFFGPVMVVWFLALAMLGIGGILHQPSVLRALSPVYAVAFFVDHGWAGMLALGGVVFALTGAEALYADMGHFGRRPIRVAWYWLVMPGLLLNYFGQGALLLTDPTAIESPFYLLAPSWALYPMVAVSTLATVIASQAVISGAFSLTRQAVQLGFCPRMEIRHTSHDEYGQIYIPRANWCLMIVVMVLVVSFQSSSALAAAYGIAVTGTMVITTLLFYDVARWTWKWPRGLALGVVGFFLLVDLAFFSSNAFKIIEGGWFPFSVGVFTYILMATWKKGRQVLFSCMNEESLPLSMFLKRMATKPPLRVPGVAVFMTGGRETLPHAMLHNLKHNKVVHEKVVMLSVYTTNLPRIPEDQRIEFEDLGHGFYRMVIRYGFIEDPDVPRDMARCNSKDMTFEMMNTSFFLGRETLIPAEKPRMFLWQEVLFIWMSRNAISATDFFKIPPGRVVELGTQIEL